MQRGTPIALSGRGTHVYINALGAYPEDVMPTLPMWVRGIFRTGENPRPAVWLPETRPEPHEPKSFTEGSNDFALALYGRLRPEPGNLFFSPFSIRTVLAMSYAGARGGTAAEMRSALCVPPAGEEPHVALGTIIASVNAASGGGVEVSIANSLWGQDGAALQQEFLEIVARHYFGDVHVVDFRNHAEVARAAINQWVEEQTKRRILQLVPPRGINSDTRLVLANAVYFKGLWDQPFLEDATRVDPFHLATGGTVRASMMHQEAEMRYAQAAGYQAVDLDYGDSDLSMLVLLPDRQNGLRDLEERLSAAMLRDCLARMAPREVNLSLPRFKLTLGPMNMRHPLTALGMTLAFDRAHADFRGINGRVPPDQEALFIAAVFHKAIVEVNEEGTEAAAASVSTFTRYLGIPVSEVPVFRADHPFLFAIRDRTSGTILFLGRVADPTREG
jgi:serine protease inhibitor